MAIIRKRRDRQYSIIANKVLDDCGLSFKARGLLAYMLSMPDNWKFYVSELVNHSEKDGKTSIMSALKEMEAAGYLKRKQTHDKEGKFSEVDWVLSDEPAFQPQSENPSTVQPKAEKPQTENPHAENPYTDNPPLQRTYSTKNLNNQVLNNNNVAEKTTAPVQKRKARTYEPDSPYYVLATILEKEIKANMPEYDSNLTDKQLESKLQKWANEARLMIERDKRTFEQIKYLIVWAQHDDFWKANILSMSKLRKQFVHLTMVVKAEKAKEKNQQQRKITQKETLPDWAQNDSNWQQAPTIWPSQLGSTAGQQQSLTQDEWKKKLESMNLKKRS